MRGIDGTVVKKGSYHQIVHPIPVEVSKVGEGDTETIAIVQGSGEVPFRVRDLLLGFDGSVALQEEETLKQ